MCRTEWLATESKEGRELGQRLASCLVTQLLGSAKEEVGAGTYLRGRRVTNYRV